MFFGLTFTLYTNGAGKSRKRKVIFFVADGSPRPDGDVEAGLLVLVFDVAVTRFAHVVERTGKVGAEL